MPRKNTKSTKKSGQKKTNPSTSKKVKLGIGLTAAALAVAGTYFLYGSEGAEKNRTKVRSWMLKAKAEVLEALEEAKHMTPEEYEALIERVVSSYSKLKMVTNSEVSTLKKEMREHWERIEANVDNPVAKPKTSRKKTTRKKAPKRRNS